MGSIPNSFISNLAHGFPPPLFTACVVGTYPRGKSGETRYPKQKGEALFALFFAESAFFCFFCSLRPVGFCHPCVHSFSAESRKPMRHLADGTPIPGDACALALQNFTYAQTQKQSRGGRYATGAERPRAIKPTPPAISRGAPAFDTSALESSR